MTTIHTTMDAEKNAPAKRQRRMAREPQRDGGVTPPQAPVEPRSTKASIVKALLYRDGGATLDELCQATNWQPHTCRAFLTRLRKNGHGIAKTKGDDGVTRWTITAVAAA